MLNKIILLDGKNDLIFINWLLEKIGLPFPSNVKIISVGGKSKFISYIDRNIIDKNKDKENNVDYSDEEIDSILIIKDFDIDDENNEFSQDIIRIKDSKISLNVYYISGNKNPPNILETLLINNDGQLLKDFHTQIIDFNKPQLNKLAKVNDKNIFEAYLKLQTGRIEYTDDLLTQMFHNDEFQSLPDIKSLIEKIQEFIKD